MGIQSNDGTVLCHPTCNTFSNLHSNISDLAGMWQLRSTQDDFGMRRLEQIDETGIATRDVNHQPNQFIQHFLKRHVRTDNGADAMKQGQLRDGRLLRITHSKICQCLWPPGRENAGKVSATSDSSPKFIQTDVCAAVQPGSTTSSRQRFCELLQLWMTFLSDVPD